MTFDGDDRGRCAGPSGGATGTAGAVMRSPDPVMAWSPDHAITGGATSGAEGGGVAGQPGRALAGLDVVEPFAHFGAEEQADAVEQAGRGGHVVDRLVVVPQGEVEGLGVRRAGVGQGQ